MAISILKKILSNFSSKTSATKTSHLDLRLNEPETYSEHTKQVFSALQDYLQPKTESSLKSAATSVLTLLPKDKRESTEVWMFFELCVELAEQIPYNHPLQLKLVGLLDYLHLSPQLTSIFEDTDSNDERNRHFDLHSLLVGSMRDNLDGPSSEFPGAYVNLSAFAANLLERGIMGHDAGWAIVALRDALEEECKEEGEARQLVRDELIAAAAQWISWYGQGLFKQVIFAGEVDPQNLKGTWRNGDRYRGKGGLCMERWRFWRDGFSAVAAGAEGEKEGEKGEEKEGEREEYGTECREVAARAAAIMTTLEEQMTF